MVLSLLTAVSPVLSYLLPDSALSLRRHSTFQLSAFYRMLENFTKPKFSTRVVALRKWGRAWLGTVGTMFVAILKDLES